MDYRFTAFCFMLIPIVRLAIFAFKLQSSKSHFILFNCDSLNDFVESNLWNFKRNFIPNNELPILSRHIIIR